MKILNVGSLNIDHVYRLERFVAPGETITAGDYQRGPGGKGLNQSIAAGRAGAEVRHGGCIGGDGRFLCEVLRDAGVDVTGIRQVDEPTGHAVIQVNQAGENCIVVYPGANHHLPAAADAGWFDGLGAGDLLLLQNEITGVADLIRAGRTKGLFVLLNPAPFDAAVRDFPLDQVDLLVLNRSEACGLAGVASADEAIQKLRTMLPGTQVVVTLGGDGCVYHRGGERLELPAERVPVVDTTAAGDTFVGYLAAGIAAGQALPAALRRATAAAALSVQRPGAASSIPHADEVAAEV